MFQISHVLTYGYWFANVPSLTPLALWAQCAVYALCVAAYFAIEQWIVHHHPDRFVARALRKIKTLALTMGIIGFVFLFFRYEFIPVFSRRFMYLVWILIVAVWAGFIVPEFVKIPTRRKDAEDIDRIKRYLPH